MTGIFSQARPRPQPWLKLLWHKCRRTICLRSLLFRPTAKESGHQTDDQRPRWDAVWWYVWMNRSAVNDAMTVCQRRRIILHTGTTNYSNDLRKHIVSMIQCAMVIRTSSCMGFWNLSRFTVRWNLSNSVTGMFWLISATPDNRKQTFCCNLAVGRPRQ